MYGYQNQQKSQRSDPKQQLLDDGDNRANILQNSIQSCAPYADISFFPSSSFDEMKMTKLKKYFLKIIRMIRCFELKYKKNTCRKKISAMFLFVYCNVLQQAFLFCVYQKLFSRTYVHTLLALI